MYRSYCLLIGYVFGNFLTAEVVSRRASGKSSFDRGSGNPGMANIASQDGVKCGAVVLLGDLIKTFIPCLLCRFVLFKEHRAIASAYTGLGAILGHNHPYGTDLKAVKAFRAHVRLWSASPLVMGCLRV